MGNAIPPPSDPLKDIQNAFSDMKDGFEKIGELPELINRGFGEIPKQFNKFGDIVTNEYKEVQNSVVGKFDEVKGDVVGKFDEIKGDVVGEFNEIKGDVIGEFDQIKNWFENFPDMLKEIFTVTLKRLIWDPIDRALIQPARNFFETIIMYVNCSLNKIENFWGCFFWYVIFISQETLNLIFVGMFDILRILTSVDLLPIYYQGLDAYGYASDIFNEYTGYQLLVFPYSNDINARCFVCEANTTTPKLTTYTNEIKQEIAQDKIILKNLSTDITNQINNSF